MESITVSSPPTIMAVPSDGIKMVAFLVAMAAVTTVRTYAMMINLGCRVYR